MSGQNTEAILFVWDIMLVTANSMVDIMFVIRNNVVDTMAVTGIVR